MREATDSEELIVNLRAALRNAATALWVAQGRLPRDDDKMRIRDAAAKADAAWITGNADAEPIVVEYDDALNFAGWELIKELEKCGNNVSTPIFNGIKPMLKTVIEGYLRKQQENRIAGKVSL